MVCVPFLMLQLATRTVKSTAADTNVNYRAALS
jgi:hypothetical protein